nr:hypothetical protein [Tanacetum cinerariifolium]
MLVPQGEGLEHPSKPHHTPSDQDEPIHHEQITQSPQHTQITLHEPIPQSHEQTTSPKPTIPSQSHSVITTPRRITRGTIQISQSKVPSPGADETAFPIGDVKYREAFPTDTSLDVGQDRENIAMTSAMPHEALPRVTSLGGGEGKERVQNQDLEITHLKAKCCNTYYKSKKSSRGVVIGSSSPISFNIPSISKKDKGKGKMTEPKQPSKKKVLEQMSVQLARDLEAKFSQEDQIISEQAGRDSEIARIHAERELKMMITKLNRSNEMVAKYLRIQLDKERFKKLKIAKASGIEPTQEQQSKELKELSEEDLKKKMELVPVEELYIKALQVKDPIIDWEIYYEGQRKCWKIIRVRNHIKVYQIFKDMLKKFDREDLDKLWSLVKETYSTTKVTNEKA